MLDQKGTTCRFDTENTFSEQLPLFCTTTCLRIRINIHKVNVLFKTKAFFLLRYISLYFFKMPDVYLVHILIFHVIAPMLYSTI